MTSTKEAVRAFWDQASCGESLYLGQRGRDNYQRQARLRYELEPYIAPFADFERWRGKRVLEIGVGLGADHQQFAEAGAALDGIDLTERAVDHTRERFALLGLSSRLQAMDAERLAFADDSFDLVYSWGVLHHTPDTAQALREVRRVLKPGGEARIMVYHKYSLIGYMLWARYALLRGRPFMWLKQVYSSYLESPGTQAFSRAEARQLFGDFRDVTIRTVLTHGDLLSSGAGQRHRGPLLSVARRIWPRWLFRRAMPGHGLFMLIQARK